MYIGLLFTYGYHKYMEESGTLTKKFYFYLLKRQCEIYIFTYGDESDLDITLKLKIFKLYQFINWLVSLEISF